MKKYPSSLVLFLLYFFNPFILPVFAAPIDVNPCPSGSQFGALCIEADKLGVIVQNGLSIITLIAILVAVGYLVYGGIKWITSRGDKQEVESARNHIVASIIGLIVVLLAFFIIRVILQVFGITQKNLELVPLSKVTTCTTDSSGTQTCVTK